MKLQKKCLGNSDEKADQIAWRNEDKAVGILKTNLELRHNVYIMFVIICKTFLSEQDISLKKYIAFSELVILAVDRATTVT